MVFERDFTCKQECIGCVDSDYAGDLDKRRSTTEYVFTLSQALVSWCSILQSTITFSTTKGEYMAMTTEGEYMAMTKAIKEAIWLQGLLDDLGIEQDMLKINCNIMSAFYLIKNQVYHAKTKHIDVRFYFVREIFDEGDIELLKIHTKENPADMLTKVVTGVKFIYCKELLHILPVA